MKLRNILSNLKLNTMVYRKLEKPDGVRYFTNSLTVVPSQREYFFIDFLSSRFEAKKVRHRCLFKNVCNFLIVFLYLTDEEINVLKCLTPLPKEIYFFGEYNQTDVLQVRALGVIREVEENERNNIINSMKERFAGKFTYCDSFLEHLDENNKAEGLKSLSLSGKLYSFEPVSYAFAT